MANSPYDLLNGKGNLYVFGIENNSTSNSQSSWNNLYHGNGTVKGKFIPLEWNYMTQNETELDNEAIGKVVSIYSDLKMEQQTNEMGLTISFTW